MIALDLHAFAALRLTTARVGDAVDGRQAVRTVAFAAETPASRWMEVGSQQRYEEILSGLNLERLAVDEDSHRFLVGHRVTVVAIV
jgi:hypothetical protein